MTEKKSAGEGVISALPAKRKRQSHSTSKAAGGGSGNLNPVHLAMLRDESSISDEVIAARGYCTITDPNKLAELGFSPKQWNVPGLLIPIFTPDGANGHYRYRPDKPRFVQEKSGKKQVKYEQPANVALHIDCPPICRPLLADPSKTLWITEGEKKADALASRGQCVIDLPGVWGFISKNKYGGKVYNEADLGFVAFNGRQVNIVFDNDVMVKPAVRMALDRLTRYLQGKGAHVNPAYLPQGKGGQKIGVDDFFASGKTIEDLLDLVEAPRPRPQAAAPVIKLLDNAPATIRRPLCIVGEHAYAATWLYVEKTETEELDRSGNIITLNPPRITKERTLFSVRDDGRIFGPGADDPIEALGIDVSLPNVPFAEHLWGKLAVVKYHGGERPKPIDVFERILDVVNRFMDFDSSIAPQNELAEMVACYILATWFLDAFNVIGFLWPNGDKGTGKTKLITLISQLSYLGLLILASTSVAVMRDLAEYGATLAFDDCENLSDAKTTDPDKRSLLLAGNRRGSVIGVKDLNPETKKWEMRYVNTYCPRLFSATQIPDPILESRTIVIPLVKSPDSGKANADVLDYALWPGYSKREKLLDDLWAVALAHLVEVKKRADEYNSRPILVGRDLEPWRAILTMASWLDANGESGLQERMERMAMNYQTERPDLSTTDELALTLKAICALTSSTPSSSTWKLTTKDIAAQIKTVIEEEEVDFNVEWVKPYKVGRWMRKHRFKKDTDHRVRTWIVTRTQLERRLKAYGMVEIAI